MIRRLNYTGRKRIEKTRISIRLHYGTHGMPSFDAVFALADLNLPSEAHVEVEAYYSSSYMRFHFGTIGNPETPADRRLAEIDRAGVVFFRVKVVDRSEGHGKVLAEADGIVPSEAEGKGVQRISLLPVAYEDLGDAVWKLSFDNSMPVLVVNYNVNGIRDVVLHDKKFRALVFPAIVRAVLSQILLFEDHDFEEASDDWRSQWIQFACRIYPGQPPELDTDGESSRIQAVDWIETVVRAFCTRIGARELLASVSPAEEVNA